MLLGRVEPKYINYNLFKWYIINGRSVAQQAMSVLVRPAAFRICGAGIHISAGSVLY